MRAGTSKFRGALCKILFCFATVFLCSCSRHPQPILTGIVVPQNVLPVDSLRAKLVLTVPTSDKASEEVSGVLFAVPKQRYRLELSGPMGVQVASLLWKEGQWTALVPNEERYTQGNGNLISIPGLLLPDLSIHRLLAFAWGDLLPAGSDTAKPEFVHGHELRSWTSPDSLKLRAEFDSSSHRLQALVVRASIPDYDLRLEYSEDSMRITRAGRWLMTLRIIERKPTATWGAGVWKLIVPPGWTRF